MSQPEANKGNNSSGNVRIIPIFVEGRDQPVINSNIDIPISTSSSTASASSHSSDHVDHPQWTETHHQNHNQSMPQWEPTPSRSFGSDLPKHGSIFERAKDFPVRDFFRRSESPAKQVPVFHTTTTHQPHFQNQNVRHSPSPAPPSQQQQQKQYQEQQQKKFQEQKQQQQENNVQPTPPQPQPQQQKVPVNPREAMIQKIIDINADVAKLMDRVDKFQGRNRKDKEYLYLDEMLTQHLIRLDDLDANGDEIIKQSRRAAIQAINHTIKALEAKVEDALKEDDNNPMENQAVDQQRASSNSVYDNLKSDSNSSVNKSSSQNSRVNADEKK